MRRCCEDEEYSALFKNYFTKIVENVNKFCSDLLIVSYTPTVEKENLIKWNIARNRELEKRNQIAYEVAQMFEFPYIDIYNPLLEQKYRYKDYIHMEDEGNEFIAQCLMKFC